MSEHDPMLLAVDVGQWASTVWTLAHHVQSSSCLSPDSRGSELKRPASACVEVPWVETVIQNRVRGPLGGTGGWREECPTFYYKQLQR